MRCGPLHPHQLENLEIAAWHGRVFFFHFGLLVVLSFFFFFLVVSSFVSFFSFAWSPCSVCCAGAVFNLHDCFASRFKFDGEFTIGLSAYWMAVGQKATQEGYARAS